MYEVDGQASDVNVHEPDLQRIAKPEPPSSPAACQFLPIFVISVPVVLECFQGDQAVYRKRFRFHKQAKGGDPHDKPLERLTDMGLQQQAGQAPVHFPFGVLRGPFAFVAAFAGCQQFLSGRHRAAFRHLECQFERPVDQQVGVTPDRGSEMAVNVRSQAEMARFGRFGRAWHIAGLFHGAQNKT